METTSRMRLVLAGSVGALIAALVATPLGVFLGFYLAAQVKTTTQFEQRLAEFTTAYTLLKAAQQGNLEELTERLEIRLGYGVLELDQYYPYLSERERDQTKLYYSRIQKDGVFSTDDSPLAKAVRETLMEHDLNGSLAGAH